MNKQDNGRRIPIALLAAESETISNQIVSTIKGLRIEFDQAKSARNAAERALPFTLAADFDFDTACYQQDNRNDYSETRYVALGLLGQRLHVLCFTPIRGGIRVISFRKANSREIRIYEKARATDPT